jgi:hypothetical protein
MIKPTIRRIIAGQKAYTGIIFNPARTNSAILNSIKLFPNIIIFINGVLLEFSIYRCVLSHYSTNPRAWK